MSKVKSRQQLADRIIKSGVYRVFWDKPRFQWQITQQGRVCPAYCNLRSLIGDVQMRDLLEDALVEHVSSDQTNFPDVICGVVSSGVPWATLLSKRLDLPMCYTRPIIKRHGDKVSVEGQLKPGMKALMIDDVFSTGSTIRKTSFQLSAAGVEISHVLVLMRLGKVTARLYDPSGTFSTRPVDSLVDYSDLIKSALKHGLMNEDQASRLTTYYQNPETQPWD